MAAFTQIPIARDLRLGFFLHDKNGFIISPRGIHTQMKLFVGEESFFIDCDDEHNYFSSCEIQTAKVNVVSIPGVIGGSERIRFPKNDSETTVVKSVDIIVVAIPAFTFNSEGTLKVAFASVVPDDKFPDKKANIWTTAKDTLIKYVKK